MEGERGQFDAASGRLFLQCTAERLNAAHVRPTMIGDLRDNGLRGGQIGCRDLGESRNRLAGNRAPSAVVGIPKAEMVLLTSRRGRRPRMTFHVFTRQGLAARGARHGGKLDSRTPRLGPHRGASKETHGAPLTSSQRCIGSP